MKPLIIIPTFNEIDHIADLLNGIVKQNLSADVLIIDAQSTDGTTEVVGILQKNHPEIKMISQRETDRQVVPYQNDQNEYVAWATNHLSRVNMQEGKS